MKDRTIQLEHNLLERDCKLKDRRTAPIYNFDSQTWHAAVDYGR